MVIMLLYVTPQDRKFTYPQTISKYPNLSRSFEKRSIRIFSCCHTHSPTFHRQFLFSSNMVSNEIKSFTWSRSGTFPIHSGSAHLNVPIKALSIKVKESKVLFNIVACTSFIFFSEISWK